MNSFEATIIRVQRGLVKRAEASERTIRRIDAEMDSIGLYDDQARIKKVLVVIRFAIQRDLSWCLAQIAGISERDGGRRADALSVVQFLLQNHLSRIVESAKLQIPESASGTPNTEVETELGNIRHAAEADLIDFQAGLWRPPPVSDLSLQATFRLLFGRVGRLASELVGQMDEHVIKIIRNVAPAKEAGEARDQEGREPDDQAAAPSPRRRAFDRKAGRRRGTKKPIATDHKVAKTDSPLTTRDIAERLAAGFEIPKSHASEYVAETIALVAQHLKNGGKVRLNGLGVFEVKKRPARKGRNPATGEPLRIGASRRITFSTARDLKASL
jgi:DNA-binding protein HU-beta